MSVTVEMLMENFQKYKVLLTQNQNFRKLFAARLITLGGVWVIDCAPIGNNL